MGGQIPNLISMTKMFGKVQDVQVTIIKTKKNSLVKKVWMTNGTTAMMMMTTVVT